NPRAAEERILRALAIEPEWPPAFERMGTSLLRQRRFGEAVAWFERALRERKDDAAALQGLGVALAECGRVEEAMGCWRAALLCGVATAELHENLARGHFLLGRGRDARRHRTISRRIRGTPRFGLDLLRNAWQWLSNGPGAGR
ncbi:MAG TPA: tetratricopeptide repeat protein, partial [Myxococcales bacterium]|nr:tetratricopeptide repeat protein [Myxococcales bacterium]